MRSFQEYLREADRAQLIQDYFAACPIRYESSFCGTDMAVAEVRRRHEGKLSNLICHLCGIRPELPEDGKHGILFVSRVYPSIFSGNLDHETNLVYAEDVIADGADAGCWSIAQCGKSQIAGFYVAGTPLTQHYLNDLIIDALDEALWGSWPAPQRAAQEAATEGKSVLAAPEPPLSAEEERLKQQLDAAEAAYNACVFRNELLRLREQVNEGDINDLLHL